jgi:Bifunctional DNA primase/polymerase, N-terminal/Primase C terminal 1 (PriCT-1)
MNAPPGEALFAEWQPRYAAVDLPTFPVTGKRPLVRGYLNVGLRASAELAKTFPNAPAIGVALGKRTNLTVLDVDAPEEGLLAKVISQFGDTRFLVRTGSGHFQAWYCHNGEARRIRPFPDLPVDILGAGFVVAPPSVGLKGRYVIIRGSLEDLRRLPVMRPQVPSTFGIRRDVASVTQGRRNKSLFRYALSQARYVDDEGTLLDVARTENENACIPHLPDDEVVRLVRSAWKIQQEDRNFVGGRVVPTSFREIDRLAHRSPDALALLILLRRYHGCREEFALGKAMASKLGWSLPRFRAARFCLEENRYITCLHPGGKGKHDPPRYALRGTIPHINDN